MTINGFAILVNGNILTMELSDDITGGTTVTDPSPIFQDSEDAETAFLNHSGMFGNDVDGEIVEVTVTITRKVKKVQFRDDDDN